MSTKTTFKRIALVTVAALGFGMLSVAPSNAAAGAFTAPAAAVNEDGTGGGAAGAVTAVSASVGTVSRATINTWTAPVTLTITGTALADDTDFTITGTVTSATGTATSALVVDADGVTVASATSATITSVLTITSLTNTNIANVAASAGTYAFTFSVEGATGTAAAAAAVDVIVASTATGSFLAGTAYSGSRAALTQIVSGQATVVFVGGTSDTSYTVTSSGVGTMLSATATTTAPVLLGATTASGFTWTPVTTVQSVSILVTSATAGESTLTFQPVGANGVPGIPVTAKVTFTAAPAVSTAYSTAHIAQGAAAGTSATDLLGASLVRTAGGQVANITVTLKDASNLAISGKPLAATITGSGVIAVTDTDNGYSATNAGARIVSITAMANNVANIAVYADGTAGTGTITITSGTTTIATKTVSFFGTVATLKVTQNLSIARAGALGYILGSSAAGSTWLTAQTTPAVYIEALDAAGVVVPNLTISAVSSDVLVIAAATINQDDATAGDGPGYYNASVTSAPNGVSGATATVTFRTQLSTGAFVSSTPVTFTLGGTASTMKVALDKPTYAPGDAMVVTRTALDASGNPVYDGVVAPAVSFTKANGGTAPVAGEFVGGKLATSATRPSVFAPSVDGTFQARMSYTVSGVTTVATADASVENGVTTAAAQAAADAAAEATDAANAATDAANAAAEAADAATAAAQDAADAVAALSTQVTELVSALRKQITSLTNLVIKIQKKVRA